MIQNTTWKPDTCKCVVVVSWDDTLPSDQRVQTLASIVKCKHHDTLSDDLAYDQVLNGENTLKNQVIGIIGLGELPFAFDKDRKLEITLPDDKTKKEKDDMQVILDSSKGKSKVLIK